MAQNSSRLQRLLTLLETGSTQATRFAAARQIGDIARSHPQDLSSLLKKVSHYLRSRNWDTRVAAAHAVGAIAQNVKHTSLKELLELLDAEIMVAGDSDATKDIKTSLFKTYPRVSTGLSFKSFDINKVLEFGSPLLASAGQEYDVTSDGSKNPAERLNRQKANLRRRLGLDGYEHFMDVNDVIKDEDLVVHKSFSGVIVPNRQYSTSRPGQHIQQLVATMVTPKRLSARELNLLKRKAKVSAKDQSKCSADNDAHSIPHPPISENSKGARSEPLSSVKDASDGISDEDASEQCESGTWPLRQFLEQLVHDMFDPLWEVRHGTIMALREILTHQGSSAGVYFPDLSLDIPLSVDCDIKDLDSTKRGCEIDLNMQFSDDDYEPDSKRPKVEQENFPQNSREFSENQMTCTVGMDIDGYSPNLPFPSVNGNINFSHVKVEPDVVKNGFNPKIKEEVTTLQPVFEDNKFSSHQIKEEVTALHPVFENSSSFLRMNFLASLPESCKLMKLMKLARHSWNKNWEFLQDCAIRFLCVLSLDRFGDYVSDQVVAPVRETCAQALGAVLKFMHPSLVRDTLRILLQMQCRQEWEVRHGSLLGIKYLVAVRPEMLPELLIHVLPACKAGLEDPDDDVRAVAAEALIPAASAIVSSSDKWLHSIVMLLWDILLDLDDLSPSTSSVMNLLAEIYSLQAMVPKMLEKLKVEGKQELDLNQMSQTEEQLDGRRSRENPCMFSTLTPRLWPFMRHTITSVRRSAIRTLERLLEVSYSRSSHEPMSSYMGWPTPILCDALRIVFQNMLLENDEDILHSSKRVWRLLLQCPEQDLEHASQSYFSSWLQLATTPYGSALDATKMYWPVAPPCRSRSRAAAKMRAVMHENGSIINFAYESGKENISQERSSDISLNATKIIVGADVSPSMVSITRVASATALGIFASRLPVASLQVVVDSLWNDLVSLSGVQRQVASIVLVAWFKELKDRDPAFSQGPIPRLLDHVKSWMLDLLSCSDPSFPTKNSLLPYSELSRTYAKMRSEVNLLLHSVESLDACKDYVSSINFEFESISVDDAYSFANNLRPALLDKQQNLDKVLFDGITFSIQEFERTVAYLKCIQNNLHIAVTALVASAVVHMSELPSKLNPVILPLMAAIKREQEEILQQNAAEALAELIFHCVGRKPSPNDKLIKNLCNLTCADFVETPQAKTLKSIEVIEEQNLLYIGKSAVGQKSKEDRTKSEGFISRRGSEMALKYLSELFGSSLFDKLPKLWDCLMEVLKPVPPQDSLTDQQLLEVTNSEPQVLINNIQVVRSVAPVLDESLRPQLLTLLPCLLSCVRHHHVAVRLAASRCLTSMANSMMSCVMGAIVEKVITMLSDAESVYARQGAGMLVNLLVQGLGVQLVPYAPVLVVPLLRCMSDSDHAVRQTVTHSFAAVVPLLPLARGLPAPDGLSESLSKNADDAQFLEQLLDNSQIEDFRIPFELKVSLRRYQQEGVNWLAFLRRFKLHGILCDDMGLGKTLQASSIVAADIVERRASTSKDLSSLIICPSTLVGHWAYEIEKYIDASLLIALQYTGSNPERLALRDQFEQCNVIITSYDVVRKDIDFLGTLAWNYCILDEGHIIKNSRSKITVAIKQLNAQHRLILSGTPIQNNVLELWSLFDFLMPGFLGTERQFQATYGKPLLAAKDSKCNAKDAEAGVLAMEALHKQVMPFLLRRTKDEVLSDLPEKIIQDRYCDLSPLQLKLYEQFSSSNAKKEISELVKDTDKTGTEGGTTAPRATSHVFQAMQYLLKLCSHPLLVVGEKPPDSLSSILAEAFPGCEDILRELHELQHSPKLVALKEILEECGIGLDASNGESNEAVGHHRVLIFAQHKSLLDVIERDLFTDNMKSVTYLRLDGSVNPEKRFSIVKTFNSDPTIDVLLLTTHVGGLGLNLTSADTVVFMEHDWNPMKDLQAMDRAHRLGQRKVVNVHRLIMRGTLEEKIMGLQRFKLSVANAVVNTENSSLKTMNTDQLLDLFTSASTNRKGAPSSSVSHGHNETDANAVAGGKGLKSVLSGLDELWDQSQYTDEYNLSQFLAKLNG